MFKRFTVTGIVCAVLVLGAREVEAQGRDSVLNGAVIGAVVGAGAGVAFTHAVRDSDLVFSQCARGAIIFGAIGAGIGLGVDAMFSRMSPRPGARHDEYRSHPPFGATSSASSSSGDARDPTSL